MNLAIFLALVLTKSTTALQKYCKPSERFEYERKKLLVILNESQRLDLIVNSGTIKNSSEEFVKDLDFTRENLTFPIKAQIKPELGLLHLRILRNNRGTIGIGFLANIRDVKEDEFSCVIFPDDCKRNKYLGPISATHLWIKNRSFKQIFLMKACHLFKVSNPYSIKVRRELLILTSTAAHKDWSAVKLQLQNNTVTMANLSFSFFDMLDYDICDHLVKFLNQCKNIETRESNFNFKYAVIAVLLLFGTNLICQGCIYFLRD